MQPSGVAFLLAQVGTHATRRFTERAAELGLTPAHVGVLRVVAQRPGLSQQALAQALQVLPSRVVALVDDLEAAGALERRRDGPDRRQYALHLAAGAPEQLAQVRAMVVEHDRDLTAGLTDEERDLLGTLLRRVADQQGLAPGVHPGSGPPAGR